MKNWKYIEGAKTGNEKAISSTFYMNDYGVEVGQWSWDWRGKAPDEKKQNEIAQKIKSYVQQINKNVPAGDSDERDEVFSKLDKFVRSQGLNKKIGNEKTGAEEFFKKLSDDVKEREDKDDEEIEKVGNANLETSVEKGKLGLWNWYVHKDGTIVSGGTSSTETNAKEMARKALEKEKVGNFKTGTSALKPGDKVMSFGKKGTVKEVIGENTDNIYGEPLIKVEFEDGTTKTIGEHYMRKVGNSTVSEYNSEIQRLTKKAEQLRRMGQGKSAMEVEKQIEKLGKELAEVGNSVIKTGNFDWKDPQVIERQIREAIKKGEDRPYIDGLYHALEKAKKEREDFKKKYGPNSLSKFNVENSSDDKFAYVMREFDAGKLKTPDGKVVTDPAQAKAIAYSESKKTENGLARARKAMNKGITMWKGNDSAYIKEDGTVSYLENNSFETDKDKFESQESAIKELSKQGYGKK